MAELSSLNQLSRPLSPGQLLELGNQLFEQALPAVLIEGEVAGFSLNKGKFIFFDIRDEVASFSCFMMAFKLVFPLQDGMRVRLLATPKLMKQGRLSLTIQQLQPLGDGDIRKSLDQLRASLTAEGLFAAAKRPLPVFPNCIGVVSSAQSAGFGDFMKILSQRWGGLELKLVDCQVQGLAAPEQLSAAIHRLNQLGAVEVIALIRGGGSVDDLAAFSSELVVRAVAGSRQPIMVGVGHERDEVLADLAADVRASTPSQAAELLVPDRAQVMSAAEQSIQQLDVSLQTLIGQRRALAESLLNEAGQATRLLLNDRQQQATRCQQSLISLDPERILQRGYSLTSRGDRLLQSVAEVTIDDVITTQLSDGVVESEVSYVSS